MNSLRMMVALHVLSLLLLVEFVASLVTDAEWVQFKSQYRKQYSGTIDAKHRMLFDKKMVVIQNHNKMFAKGQVGYWMGLSEFSDTDQKLVFQYRTTKPAPPEAPSMGVIEPPGYKHYNEIVNGIDWRQSGIISPVGNQGTMCLSCWAFSTSGVVEAHLAKKHRRLVPLSPQNLVDCVPDSGCMGGWVSVAFKHIMQHGIASKASYPYGVPGSCRYNRVCSIGTLRDYVTLNSTDERQLAEVVYNIGPVAVSIDHLHDAFENYAGGVLRIPECKSGKLDLTHSVLVVGFGRDPAWGEYWLIKNSYGESWGERGYFRLARNARNMCGVATLPQYPIV